MSERQIGIWELRRNLGKCLQEVRHGTTLLLTNRGHQVARIIPEPETDESGEVFPITRGRGKLKVTKPKAHLRGGGSMADIVRENRR